MKISAIKGRVRDSILGKWRMAVGLQSNANANIKCLLKPDIVFNAHLQPNPNEHFSIKAHHPSSTTSLGQTAVTARAPTVAALEIKKQDPRPTNTAVKGFRWKTGIKSKLRVVDLIKTAFRKSKATPAPTPDAASTTSPLPPLSSSSPPPLTITIPPNLIEDHHLSVESPTDRVKRVASTAFNSIGRAFSTCLPLTSPLDQNLETSSSPTTNDPSRKPPTRVARCVASLKTKGKKIKELLKKKTKTNNANNNIFSTTTTTTSLDDMMDRMIETINTATGRNKNRYRGVKIVKKMWKRTSKWAAGV